ncbi:alkaline phosphatase family protein [Variovorax sp. LjRoot178]|uniref:alkaline phosphatase family protein n=1 Tax=Variovorax sp. LjRoot178 TaxID=3342277 RepID=UPI003ECC6F7F
MANVVCQIFVVIVKAICLVWSWLAKIVCVAWDGLRCALKGWFGRPRRRAMPIRHVFVLMLENRSFDHMLGFSGINGKDIKNGVMRPIEGAAGSNIFQGVPIAPSVEADFKLSKPVDVDPGHEFKHTVVALCGPGAVYADGGPYPPSNRTIDNSGFIANYEASDGTPLNPPNIMKCYSPQRLPILNALANEFALCDAWFSSLPGPTWPNRFFMHAASSGGLDDSPSGLSSAGNTLFDGYTFNHGTIFDRLEDACIEWRVFAGDAFPVTLALSGMTLNELQGRIHDFDDFAEAINHSGYSAAYTFIEPDYGNDLPPSAEDFTCGTSQHPLDDVTRGERLIKSVYETLRNSPHWDNSMLLVTYDEHGGFHDHVPPPTASPPGDGISDEDNVFHHFNFDRLGVRVPAVVISPLIERNIVDGTTYDHTSLLATVEAIFGLNSLTARDATASSLMKLFTRTSARTDAPTGLGPTADAGIVCSGDPPEPGSSSSSGGLSSSGGAGSQDGYDWTRDTQEAGSSLRGFQEIALLKALKNARGRDRAQIRKEYFAATTKGGAKHFMHKVAQMTGKERVSPLPGQAPGIFTSLVPLPRRAWIPTPVTLYRKRGENDSSIRGSTGDSTKR